MLKQRVLTAIVAVALLLLVLFYLPEPAARLVIGALFVAAAWEWSQFLVPGDSALRWLFPALVAILEALFVFLPAATDMGQGVLVAGTGWWVLAMLWAFVYPTPVPRAFAWAAGFLVLLPAYVALDVLFRLSPALLLALLIVVWLADIGAYFCGRRFGRVKLAPRISPGKTWEGAIGGLLLAVTAVAAVTATQGLDLLVVIPFAGALVLISIIGDLTVSMFKRHAGIKDSGTLFPGHGGVLDRIDSVCAAAPLFVVGGRMTGLVG